MLLLAAAFVSAGFLQFPPEAGPGAMSAVAVGRNGAIYVLHRGVKPLAAFDAAGRFQRAWGEGLFQVPHGLRLDPKGNLWVTDNAAHNLRVFAPDGALLATVEADMRSPDDLVFTSKGAILVADAGKAEIVELSPDYKRVRAFGRKGKAPGEFAAAHGLAIDTQDRIYVADRGNNRVQVFSPLGELLRVFTGFGNPFGLLVYGGRLLVTDGDAHRISELSLDGKLLRQWGDAESLKLPHLMAADARGRLYVTEVNGKRVQIFEWR
jgi:sugar lactone lactonase YvrE